MRAAMTLAGMTFPALAKAIDMKGYGTTTLRNIANDESERDVQSLDLYVIGNACGVGLGWWTIDFAQLENDPSELRAQISALEERFDQLAANTSAEMARLAQALQEHRETDHRGEAGEGEAQ